MIFASRTTVSATGAAILLIVAIAIFTMVKIDEEIRDRTGTELIAILDASHQTFHDWADELASDVSIWGQTPSVIALTQELLEIERTQAALIQSRAQNSLRTVLRPHITGKNFRGFFVIAPDYTSLASTRDENTGTINFLVDHADDLATVWAGQTAIILPQQSDVPLPDETGRMIDGFQTMFVVAPVKNSVDEIIALLAFRVDPANSFTALFQRGRIGETGETYAFDRNGRLISDTRFGDQLAQAGLLAPGQHSILNILIRDPGRNLIEGEPGATPIDQRPLTLMAQNAIAGEDGVNLEGYRDYRGVPVFGTWRWDAEYDFGIATEIDVAEVTDFYHQLQLVVAALVIVASAMLIILATIFEMGRRKIIHAQDELHLAHLVYRDLFENSETSIWQEDYSEVCSMLGRLREKGITDLRQYLNDHSDKVLELTAMVEVVRVNRATLNLFGAKTEADFIYRIDETLGENAVDVFVEELCAIWDGEKSFRSEINFRSLDGNDIKAVISVPIPETISGFKNIPVSITDLTELARAESALRESDDLLHSIMENAPVGISVKMADGRLAMVNPVASGRLGISMPQRLWGNPQDVSDHPLYSNEVSEFDDQIFNTGKHLTRIVKRQHEGRSIATLATKFPIFDAEGEIPYIVTISTDVTKQQEMETALRESELRYQRATAATSDAIWDFEVESGRTFFSDRFGEMLGYETSELKPSQDCFRALLHPDELQENIAYFEAFLAGEIPNFHREYRTRKKDGSYLLVESRAECSRDEQGKPAHITGVVRDITYERRREEQLQHAQKMQAVGELGGGIAHDFNNILGIVMGNLEIAKSNLSDNPKVLARIETALKGVKRGSALTDRLLKFTRAQPKNKKITSANQCLTDVDDIIAKSLTVGITVNKNLSDDLWPAEFEPGEFEDVIVNLALNARDAMPNGGTLTIETENKTLDEDFAKLNPGLRAGEFILVSISDTGTGMSAEVKDRIFEPFYSTKERGKGTGLGLSMVYGFIERSNGNIIVYSQPGEGTTFRLYLPRAAPTAKKEAVTTAGLKGLPKGTETILIVDDEEAVLEIATSHLEALGYRVVTAGDGSGALDILDHTTTIDLLFSDVIMPNGMDGFHLATEGLKKHPEMKILLASGFSATQTTQASEGRSGIDNDMRSKLTANLLHKPYSRSDLAQKIRKALDR